MARAALALVGLSVAGALVTRESQAGESCAEEDSRNRARLQSKLAGICEDMCKEVGSYPKCGQCANFVKPDSTPGVMTWEELLEHMGNLESWGEERLKAWRAGAAALQLERRAVGALRAAAGRQGQEGCAARDAVRRAQVQNRLAGVCEDMCKEVGAHPECEQCPEFVAPDATPGVMTWDELLEHMDNLGSWGREQIKGWRKQASQLQVGQSEEACAAEDLRRRTQLQNKLAGVCEEMCKEVGAYPDCKQCPEFVAPDATPGVMTWEELLAHMDNLVSWGEDQLKGWRQAATKP